MYKIIKMEDFLMIKFLYVSFFMALPVFASSMLTDAKHKEKEDKMTTLTYTDMSRIDSSEGQRWLITPKLRLTKEDIQALQKGTMANVEGTWTIATLTCVDGDLSFFAKGPDLLMESVKYHAGKNAYIVTYRYPLNVPDNKKKIQVQLSDIKVKDAEEDIGKYIVNLVLHPHSSVQSVAPHAQAVSPAPVTVPAQPQTVIVAPPVPRETVIIEERSPYYGPYYGGPGIIIGGVWGPHRHHHW